MDNESKTTAKKDDAEHRLAELHNTQKVKNTGDAPSKAGNDDFDIEIKKQTADTEEDYQALIDAYEDECAPVDELDCPDDSTDDISDLSFALDFVQRYYKQCSQQTYAAYYYAKLLLFADHKNQAQTVLLEDAISLSNKYWFWTTLADTFQNNDDKKRQACLCKAILTARPEDAKYLNPLRRDLRDIFKDNPEYNTESDNLPLYQKYAIPADAIATTTLNWLPAVVLGVKDGSNIRVLFRQDDMYLCAKGTLNDNKWSHLKRGASISVKITGNAPDIMVLCIKIRRASDWSILPWEFAVVVQKYSARKSVILALVKGKTLIVSSRIWREAVNWELGDILQIKILRADGEEIIVASKISHKTPDFVKKTTSVVLQINNEGCAWVDDDTFLPRRLTA